MLFYSFFLFFFFFFFFFLFLLHKIKMEYILQQQHLLRDQDMIVEDQFVFLHNLFG